MDHSIASLKNRLQQLQGALDSGALTPAQYEKSKAELERQILDAVMQGPEKGVSRDRKRARETAGEIVSPAAPHRVRPSFGLLSSLALFVLVIASAGYYWKGGAGLQTGSAADAGNSSGAAQPSAQVEQINAMVEKLAQRMKEQPGDAQGWAMLARSYTALERNSEALAAYEKAVALRKDDPDLLADYADAMAVKNNRSLAGEPYQLVERALKIDPKNLKALALDGAYAFELKDYAKAAKIWEKLVAIGPADSAFVKQFGPAIDEARRLAGLPPASKPLAAAAASAGSPATPSNAGDLPRIAGGAVSGRVILAAALASRANPDDTVFIFARAAKGSRMPLAIIRKQVKDLPISFTLDDSMAMSPANKLSGAAKVVVGARISKSGNAMPQPGDLAGQSAAVSVGSTGLQITISEVVQP